jgi:hypothetical protein
MSSFFWPIKIYLRNLTLSPLAPHHFRGVVGNLVAATWKWAGEFRPGMVGAVNPALVDFTSLKLAVAGLPAAANKALSLTLPTLSASPPPLQAASKTAAVCCLVSLKMHFYSYFTSSKGSALKE